MTQVPTLPDASAPKSDPLAIASIVLGVLGFCTLGVTAIVGLVLAIMSFSKREPGRRGAAVAGIAVSVIGMTIGPILILMSLLLPSLAQARDQAQGLKAMSQLQQLGVAASVYSSDTRGYEPPGDGWVDALEEYVTDMELIVSWPGDDPPVRTFAMNEHVGGVKTSSITRPDQTVYFFEAAPGSPPAGGIELLAPEPRNRAGYIVLFADGHVERVPGTLLNTFIWDPQTP